MHDIVASLGVVWVVFEVLEIFKDAELYYYFVAGRNHYLNLHDAFSFALVFFEVGRIWLEVFALDLHYFVWV